MKAVWTIAGMLGFLAVAGILMVPGNAQEEQASNAVEALQRKLDSGTVQLAYQEDGHGYLQSLLKTFNIPSSSQLLVFSASSLQFDAIKQKTPRALYYGDDISVGTVLDGRFIELIVSDKESGIAYYTLDVRKNEKPRFSRRSGECIICHGFVSRWSSGLMVANTDTGANGELLHLSPAAPFRLTDQTTPFANRYGGWYVTGQTGKMKHRGNVTMTASAPLALPDGGLNVLTLADRIEISRYLEPGSDIVSLLTLEHQAGVVNIAARLNGQYRGLNNSSVSVALRATQDDIDQSIDEIVAYMTFANEVPLPSLVEGTSSFAKVFSQAGPRDGKGRSLREFDLESRVFRYPLSYMIYSDAFDAIRPQARERILRRLYDVLRGKDEKLRLADAVAPYGAAAINIVTHTKKGLPDFWKPVAEARISSSAAN